MKPADVKPGQKIRITQTIARREGDWRQDVTGVVRAVKHQTTGSWYAHSKGEKYWLYRIQLQKDDGELTTISVDQHTDIDLLSVDDTVAS